MLRTERYARGGGRGLRGCTRGFHSVDKRREEFRRFPPKQRRQMARRTLDVHSTLLIATLCPRRRLPVAFLLPPQRHPLQHLPSLNVSNVGGACSVYRRSGYLTVAERANERCGRGARRRGGGRCREEGWIKKEQTGP